MWSVGCILAELLGEKPLFSGTSTFDQLNQILEVVGTPSKEDLESIQSELAESMIKMTKPSNQHNLAALYPCATDSELDFLSKLLQFNPAKRMKIEDALSHPYIIEYHKQFKETEISPSKLIKLPADENVKFSIKEYRKLISDFILNRKLK